MSKLRMVSGMAAAGLNRARTPAAALLRFGVTVIGGFVAGVRAVARGLWIATKAVARAIAVIGPWLLIAVLLAAMIALGSYLYKGEVRSAAEAAEATKHEMAFNESLKAAVDSAEDLDINARVRAMVVSRLAESSSPSSTCCRFPSKGCGIEAALEGVPDGAMECSVLTMASNRNAVRLMVIRTSAEREYISVEVNGQQAYLCVADHGEDLWPWIYRGIGLWEHLLDEVEVSVDRDHQRWEIDSRFGELKGKQE